MKKLFALAAIALTIAACSVPKEAGFGDVAKSVENRTGHRLFWNRDGAADAAVERRPSGDVITPQQHCWWALR